MPTSTILYDHQIFSLQRYGGISRYYTELLNRLHGDPELELMLAIGDCRNANIKKTEIYRRDALRAGAFKKAAENAISRLTGIDITYRSNMKIGRKALQKKGFDVFHPTYYDPYFLNDLGNKPFYLLIHDLTYELYPEFFDPDSKIHAWKRSLIEKATRITTVSENTKKDLVKFYDLDPSNIRVIWLGGSLDSCTAIDLNMPGNVPNKYVLFVGGRSAYKNFILFAESMANIMRRDKELYLVCVGGGELTKKEKILLSRLGILNHTVQMFTDDAELSRLYSNAQAFIFPSLYEGFGIPVIEAFSCGCPCILSRASSLPELGGDAAVYFDPKDGVSIEEAIDSVIYDEGSKKKLIMRGYERSKEFSWDRTARETKDEYLALTSITRTRT